MKNTKENAKIKDLKNKQKELKELKKFDTQLINAPNIPLSRTEIKTIKRANKKPHGEANIKNNNGFIIELNNVSKVYVTGHTKFKALRNVNVGIKRGEFVVILGTSGSGKSTLLNVISGLDRATEGEVVVNNINIAALNNRDLTTFRRNYIGFIFQSYNLLPELNAKDNAELGRSLQIDGTKREDISKLFETIGIGHKIKSPITEMSGGQLQRVSIARALAKRPQIIFADEPTGALDTESTEKVLELLKAINKNFGTTIVLVTHDRSIAKLADRVLIVKDGVAKFNE